MSNINVAGITFRIKECPSIGELKPKGEVTFFKEIDNKFDPNAVAVLYESYKIGYVPKEMNKDWKHKKGTVVKYAYMKDEKFNERDEGVLQSVTVEVNDDIEIYKFGDEEVTYDANTHTYSDSKGTLLSASRLASQFPQSVDSLIKWACDCGGYEEYKTELQKAADKGTEIHDVCEKALNGEKTDHPVSNFLNKYNPKVISTEEVVYNKELRVVGRYDALVNIGGKKILIDWKNGRKNDKYWIQLSFYAKQVNADEMWVVSFKSDSQQGYTVSKKTDIDHWYKIATNLANNYYLINDRN